MLIQLVWLAAAGVVTVVALIQTVHMDTGSGGHPSGSAASGSHSGLSPNVAAMNVIPSLSPLPAFGFGGAPAAHGGPVYPGAAQSLASSACSPLYLPPPPSGVVGPLAYPSSVSSPPHSLVAAAHCGSPYPAALQSPGGSAYASGSAMANGSSSKLLAGRHMCAICEDAASGKHYGVYRFVACEVTTLWHFTNMLIIIILGLLLLVCDPLCDSHYAVSK